jgi:predicted Zn-dependent peptidase
VIKKIVRRPATVIRGGLLGEKMILRKLSSGLECAVVPRPEFVKKFAVIAANYGSIDSQFVSPGTGEKVSAPAGVAHFLEHKMFEKEWGSVFNRFSELGANANAFTSHTVTAYHFTCTGKFWECLELLLGTVRNIHLTRRNVRKEVGIIQQEILMYQDNPGWHLATGLLEGLYQRHPVRIDTAGTVKSVAGITKKILLECFRAFYNPGNMMLVVGGALDAQEVFERCEKFSRGGADTRRPVRVAVHEPAAVNRRSTVSHMDVRRPKVLLGFKELRPVAGGSRLVRQALETDLLLGIMFGKSSSVYLRLYEKGLIDESFSGSYSSDRGFGYSVLGGDTDSPEELVRECLRAIHRVRERGISKSDFARTRKRLLGAYLRRFNSLEAAAIRVVSGRFLRHNPFRILDILDSITIDDMSRRACTHLCEEAMSVSTVLPRKQG